VGSASGRVFIAQASAVDAISNIGKTDHQICPTDSRPSVSTCFA